MMGAGGGPALCVSGHHRAALIPQTAPHPPDATANERNGMRAVPLIFVPLMIALIGAVLVQVSVDFANERTPQGAIAAAVVMSGWFIWALLRDLGRVAAMGLNSLAARRWTWGAPWRS